jgi:thiol-disulfide isomerase/thioredoxin
MRLRSLLCVALMAAATAATADGMAADSTVALPSHQVVAIYFHRTNRCPTCKRISAYIEEAIKTTFAAELKSRTVEIHLVDYEDARNARLAQGYKIASPTLVLADVRDGKVQRWTPMPKVWSLVRDKDKFFAYVDDQVAAYLRGGPQS